jgi:hypothetical protein
MNWVANQCVVVPMHRMQPVGYLILLWVRDIEEEHISRGGTHYTTKGREYHQPYASTSLVWDLRGNTQQVYIPDKNQPWTLRPPVPPDWYESTQYQYMLSVIIKTPYGYQFKSQYQYNTGTKAKKII